MKLLDTNVLVYQATGRLVSPLTGRNLTVSVITEMEVLGLPRITPQQEAGLRLLLQTMQIVSIDAAIKGGSHPTATNHDPAAS